jgi:uncharacterized membrane protein
MRFLCFTAPTCAMNKTRLEAFSDGVIAIIITIMVLEMKVPHGEEWSELLKLWPVFVSYVLSFVYVAIYWVNHHHLVHLVKRVNAQVMWANLHLLFWLSLIPFVTAWMGENHFSRNPTLLYAVVVLMAGFAYDLLMRAIRSTNSQDITPGHLKAVSRKGDLSLLLYTLAIAACFVHTAIAFAIFVAVAVMWFIPDKRIEQALSRSDSH